jgi:hypothetical protein
MNNKSEKKFNKFEFWCRYSKLQLIVLFMLLVEPFRKIFSLFCRRKPKNVENKLVLITGGGHGML